MLFGIPQLHVNLFIDGDFRIEMFEGRNGQDSQLEGAGILMKDHV